MKAAASLAALVAMAAIATSSPGGAARAPAARPPVRGPARTSGDRDAFIAALLRRARRDVDRPLVETGGRNRGPEIDASLRALGLAPGQNWCAAHLSTWLRDAAAETGFQLGAIGRGSGGAKALGELAALANGGRVARAAMTPATVPPGALVVWDRSNPPHSGWQGHIGVLERWTSPRTFVSLEANSGLVGPIASGDRCAAMDRSQADGRLLFAVPWA